MSNYHWKLFLVLAVLLGIFWYSYSVARSNRPKAIVEELEQISVNNVVKAEELTKELFELVGPEETIKLLEEGNIPSAAFRHLLSHQIGASIYQKYGPDSIILCNDDGLNGCLHGLIIEATGDIGFEGVFEMVSECKNHSNLAYKTCAHGAGHAFLAYSNYKIEPAMKMCDELAKSTQDPGEVTEWCGEGLFMENAHGNHNGLLPIYHPSLSTDDLLSPCNKVREEYVEACYLSQAGWWYQLNGHDVSKTLAQCSWVPEAYQAKCADNIARIITSMFAGQIELITKYCRQLPGKLSDDCLESSALSTVFTGDYSALSKELCDLHVDPSKCRATVMDEFIWQETKEKEIYEWCLDFLGDDNAKCAVFK